MRPLPHLSWFTQPWRVSAAGQWLAAKRGVVFPLSLLAPTPPLIMAVMVPLRPLECTALRKKVTRARQAAGWGGQSAAFWSSFISSLEVSRGALGPAPAPGHFCLRLAEGWAVNWGWGWEIHLSELEDKGATHRSAHIPLFLTPC